MKAFPWLFALAWAIPFLVLWTTFDGLAGFYSEMGNSLPLLTSLLLIHKSILLALILPPFVGAGILTGKKEVTNRDNWIFTGVVCCYGALTLTPCALAPVLPMLHLMGAASQ